MQLEGRVVVVAAGEWGPFTDTNEDGTTTTRTIPWVDLAAEDGSGTRRAVVAEGVESPALFKPMDARVELYEGGGKLKLRYLGAARNGKGPASPPAAA